MTKAIIMQSGKLVAGDKVLLTTHDPELIENHQEAIAIMKSKFPGVDFLIVGGIDSVFHMKGEVLEFD